MAQLQAGVAGIVQLQAKEADWTQLKTVLRMAHLQAGVVGSRL